MWTQTHGSGFSLSREDLRRTPVPELIDLQQDVHDRREREAKAIERARKSKA